MKFTKFLLENYLATPEGAESLLFFQNLTDYIRTGDPDNQIGKFIDKLLLIPLADVSYDVQKFSLIKPHFYQDFDKFSDGIAKEFEKQIRNGESYRDIIEEIPHFSLFIYAVSKEFSFPYLYPLHFFRVQEVCDIFDIILPSLPGKNAYKEKCLYYIQLCKTFYEFRHLHNLSPEEFCVFFYSFATHFLTNPVQDTLPNPLKLYISGANPHGDHEYLQDISTDSISYWQGNTETQPGDIIILYERAPYSHISSAWRAITPGYDDPFRYYPGVIWVGYPSSIPPVSLEELKSDPIWSKKGLVKANMQGVAGRPCTREEYAALLTILQGKNFDISQLPPLPQIATGSDIPLSSERDVEEFLLEPFLKRLGLDEENWVRQMPLRMGRRLCYYPDYVIHPDTTRGYERGAFIWEAKFRIQNEKQLNATLQQARSYAMRLDCQGLGLVSGDGVWLSFVQDSFSLDNLESFTWDELNNPDIFHMVSMKLNKILKKKKPK